MSPEFLLTSLVIAVSPGPGVLLTVAAGLGRGRRAALVTAFGCTLGIIPHMAAAILGLAAVLHTSALAFQTLKYLGVAYLFYMAWATWRHGQIALSDGDAEAKPVRAVIASAILLNLLNPKLSIFFLAFLPQFVDPATANPMLRMGELSAVFMLVTFVVFVSYGMAAVWLRRQVTSRPSILGWLRRSFAAAFAGIGVQLALAER